MHMANSIRSRPRFVVAHAAAFCVAATVLVFGCRRAEKEAASASAPRRIEPVLSANAGATAAEDGGNIGADSLHEVEAFTAVGPALPADAVVLDLHGELLPGRGGVLDGGVVALLERAKSAKTVVLRGGDDTMLFQMVELLAGLHEARVSVWVADAESTMGYPVELKHERDFQAWIDQAVPGKVRVIGRADGFEVQTNMGKVPGVDPNGPTVPPRGGQQDFATLKRALARAKELFPKADDVAFVPSYATTLRHIARSISANAESPSSFIFSRVYLVYPHPTIRATDVPRPPPKR